MMEQWPEECPWGARLTTESANISSDIDLKIVSLLDSTVLHGLFSKYGVDTMQELGVAVELGLPIAIILWDNGKLKEIEDSMVRAQIAPNAVIARNPDFCKLAEAFGAYSAAPETLEDLQSAVRQAFDADGPTLIYVTPAMTG